MPKRKYNKKIIAVVLIAAAVIITVAAIYYGYPPEKLLDSKQISPGQTYFAWDGNTAPLGYVFHEIRYNLYIKGQIVYSIATDNTSWTCPEYVYGQEGNPSYKVEYAVAWTDGRASISIP